MLKCQLCGKQIEEIPYVINEESEELEAAHVECWFKSRRPETFNDGGHEGLRV